MQRVALLLEQFLLHFIQQKQICYLFNLYDFIQFNSVSILFNDMHFPGVILINSMRRYIHLYSIVTFDHGELIFTPFQGLTRVLSYILFL